MTIRTSLLSPLLGLALLATACGGGSEGDTSTTGPDPTDGVSAAGASDEALTGGVDDSSDQDQEPNEEETGESTDPDPDGGGDDPEMAVAEFIAGGVPPEVEVCVVAGIMANPSLLAATVLLGASSDITELGLDDQVALLDLTVDCAGPELMGEFMSDGFAEGSGTTAPAGMTECFTDAISSPEGSLIMAGMIAVAEENPPPEVAREPLVATLSNCVPALFVTDVLVAELTSDPTFVEAADLECIEARYSGSSLLDPMWAAYIDSPSVSFSDLPPEVITAVFGPFFECVSFGAVMAAEAASDGVDLSVESIACIDAEAASLGLFEKMLTGLELDEDVVVPMVLGCLSREELAAMVG